MTRTDADMIRRAREGTEKHFSQQVVDLARLHGWRVFRVWNSQRSPHGWPDLFMVRGVLALAVELKVGTRRPTEAQTDWLVALSRVPGIRSGVWRPADWPTIEATLARPVVDDHLAAAVDRMID